MRILVTASRKLTDRQLVWDVLQEEYDAWLPTRSEVELFTVIHGAAPGGDTFASEWTKQGIAHVVEEAHRADWELLGLHAGHERNGRMVASQPDKCVAFPIGGASRGTRNCMQLCKDAGIPVRTVKGRPEIDPEKVKEALQPAEGPCRFCGKPTSEHERAGRLGGFQIVICDKAPRLMQ